MQKSQVRLLILTGLAVVLAALAGGKAVPIYDGVGQPDEPYRYISPLASQKSATAAPTSASGLFNASDLSGINGIYVSSAESGPQVDVALSQNSLILPAGAQTLDVRTEPHAPTAQPHDGTIAGNVYKLTITSAAGPVKVAPPSVNYYAYIDLRLPQGYTASPVLEYRDSNGSWHKLDTSQVGNDIYEAKLSGFGDYALVIPKQTVSSTQKHHRNKVLVIFAVFMLIVGMASIVLAIRLSNHRGGAK